MPAKASKGTWSLGVLKIGPQNSDQRDRLYVSPCADHAGQYRRAEPRWTSTLSGRDLHSMVSFAFDAARSDRYRQLPGSCYPDFGVERQEHRCVVHRDRRANDAATQESAKLRSLPGGIIPKLHSLQGEVTFQYLYGGANPVL